VVTTILMNFVAIHLVSYIVRWPLQEARGVFPNTDLIDKSVRLPSIVSGTGLHFGFVVAVILVIGLYFFFSNTSMGFQLRAMGGSPEATRVSGRSSIPGLLIVTFLLSGSLAGLAGGIEIAGRTFALYEGLSPGWGYTAIAVALLANLNFIAVLLTGIFFGALEGGAGAMQREAGIPATWVSAIEALVLLSVLASDRLFRRLLRPRRKQD
jgi:simple sugar transport system permease protein